MKYFIHFVAVFTFCFSLSVAEAQNKVVVVPLGGKKGNPAPLAKTGQTLCYDPACTVSPCDPVACAGTGEDGELQTGVTASPRFTDNGDGTVTDRLTGLIWLQEGNCITFFGGDTTGQNPRTWGPALEAANKLASGYCGLTDGSVAGDWRLPNIRELQSLLDYSQFDPALPPGHPFLNAVSSYYWSSTTGVAETYRAWQVDFYDGYNTVYYKWDSAYVRAVRGGQ
ncbi:MAG: DUF1566 domain-containing protein [Thermodesulfobacteriota bacterium]